jgi:hypothetical protein
MKYVMFRVDYPIVQRRIPVIFPSLLVHKIVAKRVDVALREHFRDAVVWAESAGEIGALLVDGVGGRSSTMNLESRDRDKGIINGFPYLHGICNEETET